MVTLWLGKELSKIRSYIEMVNWSSWYYNSMCFHGASQICTICFSFRLEAVKCIDWRFSTGSIGLHRAFCLPHNISDSLQLP